MTPKRALLVGASGLVGSELLKQLLSSPNYEKVTVIVRKLLPLTHPKLSQHKLDFKYLEGFKGGFPCDEVFCCLGTTIKIAGSQAAFHRVDFQYPLTIARLAYEHKATRFSLISALGASIKSGIFYNQVKGELEQELLQIGFPALDIFRPSLLLGARPEFRLGEKLAEYLSPLLMPILIGSWRKYRPIQASVVSRAMILAAEMPASGSRIFESDAIAVLGR